MATRFLLTPNSAEFTGGVAALTTVFGRPALAYDASTVEAAYWTVPVPSGWTGTGTAVLSLIGAAAGTNSVYFQVFFEAITSGDATDLDSASSFGTANNGNVAMPATQGHMTQLSITLTNDDSVAAADYLRIAVQRDATNASDNFAADAYLLLVEIRDAA